MGYIERAKNPRWAWLRLVLGLLQMTGAATTALLLLTSGVTRPAIGVAVVTGLLTAISLGLFHGR